LIIEEAVERRGEERRGLELEGVKKSSFKS
jgi:hypothetical protein